jgi:hypothetical protein
MWQIDDQFIEKTSIGSLEPIEVLFEVGCEAITYVSYGLNQELILVHILCVSGSTSRYLAVQIDNQTFEDLKNDRIYFFKPFKNKKCWIVDIVPDKLTQWRIENLFLVDFFSIPKKYLPIDRD